MERSKPRGDGRRFAINGRFLTQRMTGVQRYAHEIVTALDELLSQGSNPAIAMRLVVPSGAETKPSLSKIEVCRTRFGSGHAWDQAVLPLYAEAGVLSLGNFGPVLARNHIVCIHDANTFILPESYSRSFGLIYRTLLPLVGRRARRVATVSRFSADMLVKYGISREEKIFIAPNGHEHVLRWDAMRARLPLLGTLKRPYILLLGSSANHKNVDIILKQAQAFDEAGIDVLVAGGSSSIFAANEPTAQRPNIHHAGFVGDNELAALYENAMCLVFPSKTEGFGIPPLVPMARPSARCMRFWTAMGWPSAGVVGVTKQFGTPLSTSDQPNDLWCADDKGDECWPLAGTAIPLTIADFRQPLPSCLRSPAERHGSPRLHCFRECLQGVRSAPARPTGFYGRRFKS